MIEKRKLGKTGHMSSALTLGGAAFNNPDEEEANRAIELALSHGVNHIDVAPLYGKAESVLAPWLQRGRKNLFLACKTTARDKDTAWGSIRRSLETLRTDYFDLFQFHMVDDLETLSVIMGPGGALEAVLEAKEQGLIKYIGITGHRPFTQCEALNRFDFDTVMCPVSRLHRAHTNDFTNYLPLLKAARRKDAGAIAIKTIAKQAWKKPMHNYRTWYEPFSTIEDIEKSIWFTLSQDLTTATLPGDMKLWPLVIDAAERYRRLSEEEQDRVAAEMALYQPIYSP